MNTSLPGLIDISASAGALLVLGGLLSVSILVDTIASRTQLPRISLLVLVGVGYALLQQTLVDDPGLRPLGPLREPLINLALVMVAFLLGGQLTLASLRRVGVVVLVLSLAVVLTGFVGVGLGLSMLGYVPTLAFVLAAISVATDPAAVAEAVKDAGTSDTPRARVVLGIVAIDDAWGIVVFGVTLAALGWLGASNGDAALATAAWEFGGALVLGVMLGLPAAWLTGRLQPGRPTQAEALALMLLIAGLSESLHVSPLLAAMVAGFLVVNLSSHHERSFAEIEQIEWPFLVFFFVLAGASIELSYLTPATLALVIAYVLLRIAGRYLGGTLAVVALGSRARQLPRSVGLALMPQAGVAIGMALLATERFPEQASLIMATVVLSTIAFELLGPPLTQRLVRGPD